jgi:hypothetical protein
MRASIYATFGCGLCFAVVGFAFFGFRDGLGVLLGGCLAAGNLFVFARVGQAFVSRQGNTAPWMVVAILKLLLLFGAVSIILKSGLVSGLSLAAGYGALPFGITFASLFGPKPSEDADDGGLHPPNPPGPTTESSRRGQDVIKRRRLENRGDDEGGDPPSKP